MRVPFRSQRARSQRVRSRRARSRRASARRTARLLLTVALWPLAQSVIYACPICFQINDAHMTAGVRAAVVVLVAVTVGVVGTCAVFFNRLIKRQ